MAAPDAEDQRLKALGERIEAARRARAPTRDPAADKFNAAALAWRMVTELVVGVLIGAAMGWGIDALAGTRPLFLILFALLGFAAGVRVMLRSAAELDRRNDAAPPDRR